MIPSLPEDVPIDFGIGRPSFDTYLVVILLFIFVAALIMNKWRQYSVIRASCMLILYPLVAMQVFFGIMDLSYGMVAWGGVYLIAFNYFFTKLLPPNLEDLT